MSKTDSKLWQLDRGTFNHVVKAAAKNRREKYEEFLNSVDILKHMDHCEKAKICDVIANETFAPGEFVITQGEQGHTFYLVMKGQAVATKNIPGQEPL